MQSLVVSREPNPLHHSNDSQKPELQRCRHKRLNTANPCSEEVATRLLNALFLAFSLLSLVALPGLVDANSLASSYFRPASLGERLLSGEHESHTEKGNSCRMRTVHLMFERHWFCRSCSAQFRSCSLNRQGQFSVPSSFFKKSRNDCSTWLLQASPTVLVVQKRTTTESPRRHRASSLRPLQISDSIVP